MVEWLINRRTVVYIASAIITWMGIQSLIRSPKELFPEVVFPEFHIVAVYPGASPVDIENLVVKPIEKEVSSISGIDKIESFAYEDMGIVVVRFQTGIDDRKARQDVENAVNRAELPSDMPSDPQIRSINFAEVPVIYVYLYGNVPLYKMREYARQLKERIEEISDVARVSISGAGEKRIIIETDIEKMALSGISFNDISNAINRENVSLKGGEVLTGNKARGVRVGHPLQYHDIKDIVVSTPYGENIPIREIARVYDTLAEHKGEIRFNGYNAIALAVIKKANGNIVSAVEDVRNVVNEWKLKGKIPEDVHVALLNDLSERVRLTLQDLNNSIVIGFILVAIVLWLFIGFRQAFIVALAVPFSAFISFAPIPVYGYTINMIVLFALLFTLGIVVDDAIVVVENTHRLREEGRGLRDAIVEGVKEVFLPVLSGTLTTMAPFFPLSFFPGIVGQFIHYFPVMVITSMTASILVAYLISPVLIYDFFGEGNKKKGIVVLILASLISIILSITGYYRLAILIVVSIAAIVCGFIFGDKIKDVFNRFVWNPFFRWYEHCLSFLMTPSRSFIVIITTVLLFFVVIILFSIFTPRIVFIPGDNPSIAFVSLRFPEGTSYEYVRNATIDVEKRVLQLLAKHKDIVDGVVSQVGVEAPTGDGILAMMGGLTGTYNQSRITIYFVPAERRSGINTDPIIREIADSLSRYSSHADFFLAVESQRRGPPTGKALQIELRGDDLDSLYSIANTIKDKIIERVGSALASIDIGGNIYRPSINISIDRQLVTHTHLSSAQIGDFIRTAMDGKKIGTIRTGSEDIEIWIRGRGDQARDLALIEQLPLSFRDMGMRGQVRHIPTGSLISTKYGTQYSKIQRINRKRVIYVKGDVLPGTSTQKVVNTARKVIDEMKLPPWLEVYFGGEQEAQRDTISFLQTSMVITIFLLLAILLLEFGTLVKTFIILLEVVLSAFGVIAGFLITQKTFAILLSGMGIVALAGIVIKNGILVIEFIDRHLERGYALRDAVVRGTSLRARPVILTALTTILGLLPLAVGFAIDLNALINNFELKYSLGGESTAFWGPLSWTIIFGLTFSTILTLFILPSIYYVVHYKKHK